MLRGVKVVTWNVNSVRQRLPRLLALLARYDPDVVCLQETKVTDEDFPFDELSAAGYHATSYGQRAYNGVAIVSKEPQELVSRGFAGDPVPDEARVVAVRARDLSVVERRMS